MNGTNSPNMNACLKTFGKISVYVRSIEHHFLKVSWNNSINEKQQNNMKMSFIVCYCDKIVGASHEWYQFCKYECFLINVW